MKNFKFRYLIVSLLLIFSCTYYRYNTKINNDLDNELKVEKINNRKTSINSSLLSLDNEEETFDIEGGISLYYFVNSPYDLSKEYVYVKSDSDQKIISSIRSSADVSIEDGILKFTSSGYPLDEWLIVRVKLNNFIIKDSSIAITDSISYEEFINNIVCENATYKIFKDDIEVVSGDITVGMKLKFYYNEDEIDSYDIINEYLDLDKINIKDSKYVILNVTTLNNLKKQIETSGNIVAYDKDGNIIADNQYLTTDSKIKIFLSSASYEYTVVILGDITGSGDIFIGDISKLYQYYKGIIEMDDSYVIAGDVTYDGVVEINDIAKLYQYYKKVINSLE